MLWRESVDWKRIDRKVQVELECVYIGMRVVVVREERDSTRYRGLTSRCGDSIEINVSVEQLEQVQASHRHTCL